MQNPGYDHDFGAQGWVMTFGNGKARSLRPMQKLLAVELGVTPSRVTGWGQVERRKSHGVEFGAHDQA